MKKLVELRKRAGLSQKQVAEKLGISESAYSRIEGGSRRLRADVAVSLAGILNATLNDIFLSASMTKRQVVSKRAPIGRASKKR